LQSQQAAAAAAAAAASQAPLTEEQRRAQQRERELAARARLKAYVASDGWDGRATVDFYGFGKILGTGSFGEVRLAWHRLAGVKVAIKSYEKSRITDPSQWKRVQQEVEVLARINHLHGLRLFETIDTPKRIHIVTEYCSGGNLCTYVKGRGRLPEGEARRIFTQLVASVEYLHGNGIIHRDIKLENVLFADERRDVVKLVDYGFAVVVPDPWRRLRIFCGTPSYMAPEICQRREYHGRPVDVWSLGVLLYACVVGRFPFSGKTYPDLYKRIVAGQLAFPDHVSSSARDLLRRMLTVDPARRLSLANVATHPWVTVGLPAPTAAAVAAAAAMYGTLGAGGAGAAAAAAAGAGGIMASSSGLVSSLPPVQAPDRSVLVSADPSNDVVEAVLQRCEHLGFRRGLVVSSVLAREKNAATTTCYLLLTRLGRSARLPPPMPPQAGVAGGAGAMPVPHAYGASGSSSSGGGGGLYGQHALGYGGPSGSGAGLPQRPQSGMPLLSSASAAAAAAGGYGGARGRPHAAAAAEGSLGSAEVAEAGSSTSHLDTAAAAGAVRQPGATAGGRAAGSVPQRPMSAAPATRRPGLQQQQQQQPYAGAGPLALPPSFAAPGRRVSATLGGDAEGGEEGEEYGEGAGGDHPLLLTSPARGAAAGGAGGASTALASSRAFTPSNRGVGGLPSSRAEGDGFEPFPSPAAGGRRGGAGAGGPRDSSSAALLEGALGAQSGLAAMDGDGEGGGLAAGASGALGSQHGGYDAASGGDELGAPEEGGRGRGAGDGGGLAGAALPRRPASAGPLQARRRM
jgi:hypothetical protein